MTRKASAIIFFITIGFTLISCRHEENFNQAGGVVELYLLDSYETLEFTNFQIDETTIRTLHEPLIYYHEFINYNSQDYTFTLSEAAKVKIKNLDHSVHGLAFAVNAKNEIIYTGYFWPGYSSMSCDWVVIDPIMINDKNEMVVRLGYPGPIQGISIPDKRNDPQLLEIFRQDNKLIE